ALSHDASREECHDNRGHAHHETNGPEELDLGQPMHLCPQLAEPTVHLTTQFRNLSTELRAQRLDVAGGGHIRPAHGWQVAEQRVRRLRPDRVHQCLLELAPPALLHRHRATDPLGLPSGPTLSLYMNGTR